MKTKYKKTFKIAAYLITGILIGWLFIPGISGKDEHAGHDHEQTDQKEIIWTCSMHPQVQQHEPGLCPICAMGLVPLNKIESDDETIPPLDIQMTESAIKLADIQTMVVTRDQPVKNIYLSGKIKSDERNIASLTARYSGRIESLSINFTGQKVYKGQSLGKIYSPELINAQKELMEAIKYKDDNLTLYQSVRNKLKLWNLSDDQILKIEENNEPLLYFDIISPISGTVSERNVAVGDYVNEGSSLFKIIDLSSVWVMLDAYESDLPWIKTGDKVSYSLQSLPGSSFEGKISFIDPFIDSKTRVTELRVEAKNTNDQFKPEMFVNGIIESKTAVNSNELMIPKSAVLWTGKRAIVYVKVPDANTPAFRYTEITLGPETGNYYVVNEGLNEGDEIAVNGVFKIDAAAQLSGLPSMMNPDGGRLSMGGHNHGDMKMGDNENMDHKTHQEDIEPFQVPKEFKTRFGNMLDAYYNMKEGFVKSDATAVLELTNLFEKSLKKVDMSLLKGDAHMTWMKFLENINRGIANIKGSEDIDQQRIGFEIISDQLIKTLESFGINDHKNIYVDYCPMAFDDKGAYWLSNQKEIRNPYFGDMMLKCGEVKKTIESK